MSQRSLPKFSIGEVAILQPPHPTAKHLWGLETTILSIQWSEGGDDAMGGFNPHWCYETDIPAPPATDLPEDQHDGWIWCEYDLKKKHDGGDDFVTLMEKLSKELVG
jgi:hypothetical protein